MFIMFSYKNIRRSQAENDPVTSNIKVSFVSPSHSAPCQMQLWIRSLQFFVIKEREHYMIIFIYPLQNILIIFGLLYSLYFISLLVLVFKCDWFPISFVEFCQVHKSSQQYQSICLTMNHFHRMQINYKKKRTAKEYI